MINTAYCAIITSWEGLTEIEGPVAKVSIFNRHHYPTSRIAYFPLFVTKKYSTTEDSSQFSASYFFVEKKSLQVEYYL